ncbi:hypothetical protein [Streptomyces sp. NPDC059631]|uniref:hypothetical protein n=1 Tax=unclassified Streptomyces TaxID=2593676 RepID=UPI0036CF72E4
MQCFAAAHALVRRSRPAGAAEHASGLPLSEAFRAEHRRARGDDTVLTFGAEPFRAQLNQVLALNYPPPTRR